MSQKCAKPSTEQKGGIMPNIYMVSAQYTIEIEPKRGKSVYEVLHIGKENIKSLDIDYIHALLSSCNRNIVLLHAEILCRAKGGLKT